MSAETQRRLQILCKWRALFAGWQLGTRSDTDPECRAVKDHRELTILLRAEVNALTGLMIEKGVFTAEEFDIQLGDEAAALNASFEARWPGATATEHGISYDLSNPLLLSWMREFKP